MSTRERRRALLWLLLATVIWGAAFPFTRAGMVATGAALARALPGAGADRMGPLLFIVLRFVAATLLGCALPGALRALRGARAWRDAALVGVPNLAGFLLQSYGMVETSATLSAFLTSAYVVVVPALAALLDGVRPPRRLVAGALLTIAGIAVLAAAGDGARGFGRGEALSLLCALAFALQVYLLDAAARRTEPFALALGTFAITGAGGALLILALPGGRATLGPGAIAAVLAEGDARSGLLYAAVLASVAAIAIMYRYQSAVSPTRAAIVYAAEPAFAALFAAFLGGERLCAAAVLGGSLIIAGNVAAELRRRAR